jgi:hemerythrin-like domain-containing protein
MNPLQVLMDEHRVIERAIGALSAYARQVGEGAEHPRADLAELVAFIREYADRHHHGKEEDILFRAMAAQGMPVEAGPLAVMLAEHDQGRAYTQALAKLAAGEGHWDEKSRQELASAAIGYAQLLLAHIQKEDGVLYPMASQVIPEEAWEPIATEFEAFETNSANAARASRFVSAAATLAERYRG